MSDWGSRKSSRAAMSMLQVVDAASESYVGAVASAMSQVMGSHLLGVYLHGSGVLGGFDAARSDVDLLAACAQSMTEAEQAQAAQLLSESLLPCPAWGLELSVVTAQVTQSPTSAPDFELHVTTAPEDTKVVNGHGHGRDPDLVLHLAVARTAGRLVGPGLPTGQVFARVPDELIIAQLATELRWAAEHAVGEYAVLNACRAWRFSANGAMVSKLDGGRWALGRVGDTHRELIEIALDRQASRSAVPLDHDLVMQFVQQVQSHLVSPESNRPD